MESKPCERGGYITQLEKHQVGDIESHHIEALKSGKLPE